MKKTVFSIGIILTSFLRTEGQLLSADKTGLNLANATIVVDDGDVTLVKKIARLLQQDIEAVTGKKVPIQNKLNKSRKNNIIIGTLSNGRMAKKMLAKNKAAVESLEYIWEGYWIQTIDKNLVIAGSDRRGLAYGVFELSRQIGVSPWYWWADVPVKKQTDLFINPKTVLRDAPGVKYRGIFINDEAPALSNWSKEKFGGFNHLFYEKVFELMLRLKANYLWPAMWGNAFYHDDPLNIKSADEYGIVIGTSHHEPLMRAHEEWKYSGSGKWNYDSNKVNLQAFWKGGMQRATNEKIVSIGMRGDGDEPMSRETATALLERIVKDQRNIIEEVTGKPADQTPQLWALYKEVQDYYDKGMRVPDDVTLLLCDDNWGNIRKLPELNEPTRKGGYGIYYHFDYVGGPRNYKWLNTNQIARIWEQMHLAWEYNAQKIWIVNVGDIKPMELPLSFFLDYAWNPEKIDAEDLQLYTEQWAAAQFGQNHTKEIAAILTAYTKYNARRKPELLDADTYSLHYNEWATVVNEYNELLKKALALNDSLDAAYKDAFFQLVLYPVMACANLNEMYYNVALNKQAYDNKWEAANSYAEKVKQLFRNDSLITLQYHRVNNGKWNHMMSQVHIGYTYWQQPSFQKMPAVYYVSPDSIRQKKSLPVADVARSQVPDYAERPAFYEDEEMGVSIEAAHFTRKKDANNIRWKLIPELGRTLSSVTPFPVTAAKQQPGGDAPRLEYDFYTFSKGNFSVQTFFAPTLNFHNTAEGLQFAISVDNELPQIFSLNKNDVVTNSGIWNKWVAENIIIKQSKHNIGQPGKHTIKYWMIDPAVVLEKIVISFGNLKQTYLGPPETIAK
jgi:uncharacterized protein YbcI